MNAPFNCYLIHNFVLHSVTICPTSHCWSIIYGLCVHFLVTAKADRCWTQSATAKFTPFITPDVIWLVSIGTMAHPNTGRVEVPTRNVSNNCPLLPPPLTTTTVQLMLSSSRMQASSSFDTCSLNSEQVSNDGLFLSQVFDSHRCKPIHSCKYSQETDCHCLLVTWSMCPLGPSKDTLGLCAAINNGLHRAHNNTVPNCQFKFKIILSC